MVMKILIEILFSHSRKIVELQDINKGSALIGNQYYFSQRTINEWYKLSTDCVIASSVDMLKNKVDTSQEGVHTHVTDEKMLDSR